MLYDRNHCTPDNMNLKNSTNNFPTYHDCVAEIISYCSAGHLNTLKEKNKSLERGSACDAGRFLGN